MEVFQESYSSLAVGVVAITSGLFGRAPGPLSRHTYFNCGGGERRLVDCTNYHYSSCSGRYQDAGVQCRTQTGLRYVLVPLLNFASYS